MKIELDVKKMSDLISEFLDYKKECEIFGRGYNIKGFCELYILSENNKKSIESIWNSDCDDTYERCKRSDVF